MYLPESQKIQVTETRLTLAKPYLFSLGNSILIIRMLIYLELVLQSFTKKKQILGKS